ncbi:MAG: DUF4421 family protein [Puia sp.]|nr:DUF4421 family protein [Puia sp.]
MTRTLLLISAGLLLLSSAGAQTYSAGLPSYPDHDTSYYRSYRGSLMVRLFFSRNYSLLKLDPPGSLPLMKYHANTPLNIGVGFTYKYISFSVSKGLGFLQSDSKKGTTHSFDLQTHIYKRKWSFDALAQFYKGYYLGQPNLGPPGTGYYLRPDMALHSIGVTAYRVLNDRHFSYGAGLSQNALQQKSAGSFLIGGNVFYTAVNGDSSLAPYEVDTLYDKANIRKLHLFEIGPGIGYAYTFVYRTHYFALGSVNANFDAYFSREIGNGVRKDRIGFSPNYILRFGAGYNANKWGISALWFTGGVHTKGESSGYQYTMTLGSYRLQYVRRFGIGRRMKRILE